MLTPFLYKRKSFEHEQEVRAIMTGMTNMREDVKDSGKYCPVDIGKLVHEVVVSPLVQEWFLKLVQSVSKQYGLEAPVRKSALADLPVWG